MNKVHQSFRQMAVWAFIWSSIFASAILSAQSPIEYDEPTEPQPYVLREVSVETGEVIPVVGEVSCEIEEAVIDDDKVTPRADYVTKLEIASIISPVIIIPAEPIYVADCNNHYPDSLYRVAGIALKSNLLFDLAGAPNLGVEIPLGKKRRFSVTADLGYAYWQINNRYALQTFQGGIGAKYWFDTKKGSLTGWNVGIYGIYGGRYDVQWKDGYQGDRFWSAGLGGGYAWRISCSWRLELAVAAGVFHTPEVRHYHRPENGHLIWDETRYNVTRFFPTKLQLNLVWTIGHHDR